MRHLGRSNQMIRPIAVLCAAMTLLSCLMLPGVSCNLLAEGRGEYLPPSELPLILDRPAGLPRSLFPFHSYGAASGLGNLAVRRIVQDMIGFLWVGTEDGLYRFDGDRFTRFDSSNGLPSTWISDLLATPEGKLWVCTPQGLALQNGDRFDRIQPNSSGLPVGPCNAIARDSRGVIWVGHKAGLFFQRDGRFQRIMGFPPGPVVAVTSLPKPANSVFASGKGMVIRIEDFRITRKYSIPTAFPELVDSLAADNAGGIWAQSARRLFLLLPGSVEFRDESASIPTVSSRGVLSTDRDGRLWVPTDEGMSCRTGDRWKHFGPADGLPTDWTRVIFEDREGSLWVGSIGIHRLIGRGSWTSWTRAQGLPSDTIWDIYRSRRGDLWVATDKGLCRATANGWEVLPGTEKTVVRQIHEDSKGRLWLGLMPAGILCYDPVINTMSRYESSSGVAGLRVLCLEEDAEGQVWAATDGAGLLRYRPGKNDFVREEVPGGTPEETFRYILRDRENRLWVTGEHGLLLRSSGKWRRFSRENGLQQDHISYIAELSSGEFWLSYFEPLGIVRFTLDKEAFRIVEHLDPGNGLSSTKVYLLGEDLNNHLWVGTGRGIDVISPDGVLHFSKGDGIAGDDIDAMAFLVEPNGSVFIGTSSGLSMYRNNEDSERTQAPKPVYLCVRLGDQILDSKKNGTPKFQHQYNTLKVEFAALNFLHQSQIEYAVRLQGLETEWHNSRVRESRYPGLSPGAYIYEVRARLGSGPWSQPALVAFEIQRPWWRTWPAMAVCVLLIVSAFYGGLRWWMGHLRKRTRQLEGLVSARTIELAMANADLERLSITDPLTGLKNRRFLEFSIAEDLARVRRSFQSLDPDWQNSHESTANITFLVIDIDHFKPVNDRFGHAAGDKVLRQMGAVLTSAVRESDTTVRWGGEEFLVIARNPKGSDSAALAERIRKQVESASFGVVADQSIRLTCSIGFASWPFFRHEPDALGWQDVLGLADRCLYLAKNSGRNAWIGLASRPDYRGLAKYGILNDLRLAEITGIIEIQSSAFAAFSGSLGFAGKLKGTDIPAENRPELYR
jgi:diguanylate cyclase (GGDEF)-like protein